MGNSPLKFNKRQFIIAALMVVFVFLLMDLNSRLTELSAQKARRNEVQTEIANLHLTEAGLQGQIDYATSEAAVEDWAREKGHMQRPGDVVMIPLPEPGSTPVPSSVEEVPTVTPVANWDVWRVLLLGD